MRIEHLSLQNFRGIRSLELDFSGDRNVTVLVGVNGVGKSSILDAISSLLLLFSMEAMYPGDHQYLASMIKDSDILVTQNTTINKLSLLYKDSPISLNVEKNINKPATLELDGQCEIDEKQTILVYYMSSRNIKDMILSRGSSSETDVFVDNNRNSPITSIQIHDSKLNDLLINVSGDVGKNSSSSNAEFSDFVKWFRDVEDIENEERLSVYESYKDKNLEAVRNAVYSILGNGFTRLKIKRSIGKMVINKEGLEIAVDWLSDGEKSLLAMIGDLARRLAIANPDMENPLAGEGIVLIDEIDLHMHPAWQRMIVDRLTTTFPNCQFIVTTHSPQVLNHLPPECIYLLEKSGDDILVGHPQYSYGRDSNSILADLMGQRVRPEKIDKELSVLFDLIHDGDLVAARKLVASLAEEIGASEPELVRADAVITRKETIGR